MFDPFPTNTTQVANPTENSAAPVRKIKAPKHDFQDGLGRVFAHRHANGGGWVADTAKVDEKVFVSKRAAIYHHAVVSGHVIVQNSAQVCGAATVNALNGRANVTHAAIVGGRADITATDVQINDYAKIFGGVISGTCVFKDHAEVRERPTLKSVTVRDKCWLGGTGTIEKSDLRGNVRIYEAPTITDSNLRGWLIVKQSAVITNSSIAASVAPTTFYNGLSQEQIKAITENVDVSGSCIIGGEALVFYSDISCTAHVHGKPEFVRSKLRFSQPMTTAGGFTRYEVVTIDQNAKFVGTDFNDYNRFRAFNVPFDVVLRAPAAAGPRGQAFDFDSVSRPRRITAMEPK